MGRKKTQAVVTIKREIRGILFADIRGFSSIQPDANLEKFFNVILQGIGTIVDAAEGLLVVNTWGDAVFALFDTSANCCRFALELRDLFRRDFQFDGLPDDLNIRIAVHQGDVLRFDDPVSKMRGELGQAITTTARIEPIVAPGHIWATEQIKTAVQDVGPKEIYFDEIGERALAKNHGVRRLFNLRRDKDSKYVETCGKAVLPAPHFLEQERLAKLAITYQDLIQRIDDAELRQRVTLLYSLASSSVES